MSRERRLADTFVELADTLVGHYDLAELLHTLAARSVELSEASEAGIMLAAGDGKLEVIASSSERAHVLDVLQLQREEGPCWDCFRTGRGIAVEDLEATDRWPAFAATAQDQGFRSMNAVPLRLRRDVIGALNLFLDRPGGMASADLATVQALADIATIGILEERSVHRAEEATAHFQRALESRVLIEQAKGVVSENLHVDMSTAFELLRGSARRHNRKLTEVAEAVVTGYLSPADLNSTAEES